MRFSARVDYAVRAAAELAAAPPGPMGAPEIAEAQGIPLRFLEAILLELRRAGIVRSQRGHDGGYWLDRPAEDISLADVIRAVRGPLAAVRGERPEDVDYVGPAAALRDVWIALRASERRILECVSLAQVVKGQLPAAIRTLARDPDAWEPR